MKPNKIPVLLGVLLCLLLPSQAFAALDIDAERISEIVGVPATTKSDGVVRVSWPRDDIPLRVDGLAFRPKMGLGSWAAFQATPQGARVMGDTVVFEDEVNPAIDAALAAGLEVTALHNHFFFDDPKVYFMHIGGRAPIETLALGVRRMWDAVKEVRKQTPTPGTAFSGKAPNYGELDTRALERILRSKGMLADGVFKITIGRNAEMGEVSFGATMGLATWMAFAGSDTLAAVAGDFAMTAQEVQPVLRALRKAGINIVALHNHMIGESPAIYFTHFWGKGPPGELARGLRTALDAQNRD
jgi:hypothetical protein